MAPPPDAEPRFSSTKKKEKKRKRDAGPLKSKSILWSRGPRPPEGEVSLVSSAWLVRIRWRHVRRSPPPARRLRSYFSWPSRSKSAGWAREDARRCAAGHLTGDHVGHRGLVQEHPGHHALLVCCHRRGPIDRQARYYQPGLLLPLARSLPLSLPGSSWRRAVETTAPMCPRGGRTGSAGCGARWGWWDL